MAETLNIKAGKDEFAIVRRIVPGRLVYVETGPEKTYAFKLDKMVIRSSDGSVCRYRGEPLAELGIKVGKRVVVWGIDHGDAEPTLVVDAAGTGSLSRLGNSGLDALSGAIDYFRPR